MRRIGWRRLLPIALLVFAVASHIYEPHEYRVEARRHHVANNPGYFFRNNPALVERVSHGVNFPALVLAWPLRDRLIPLYARNSPYTLVSITPSDIAFFFSVIFFWYWVGTMLDRRRGGRIPGAARHRKTKIAWLVLGVVFGILTGCYAAQMMTIHLPPETQIGIFGFVWAAGLVAFFAWRLRRELRNAPDPSSDVAQ